jgi:hypothetical protein
LNLWVVVAFAMVGMFSVVGCVQDEESSDLAFVKYTLILTDSISAQPVVDAQVIVTWDDFSNETYKTNSQGMITLPAVTSYTNQFVATAKQYRPLDTVDIVTRPNDSLQTNILRVLNLSMIPDSIPHHSSDEQRGWVRYTFNVQNKYTGSPVADAIIHITTSNLGTITDTTDQIGRVVVDSVFSFSNQIEIQATGYQTKDTLDQIVVPLDSGSIFRILSIQLDTLRN